MAELSDFSDGEICAVIGIRIKTERLRLQMTQASVAKQAGVSLRTYKRFEATGNCGTPTFVAILRVLNRLRALEISLPKSAISEPSTPATKVERLRKRIRMSRRKRDIAENI